MAAVFAANMPELKTDDGKTVPDSTAKFVLLALADHASEDGENAYIGVKRICQKTNFSTSTVCNALNALRKSGIIELVGKSKAETNNYTINVSRLQSLKFQPLESPDSSHRNPPILATEVKPSVNHQNKPSAKVLKTDEVQGIYEQADKKMDALLAFEAQAKQAEQAGQAYRGREFLVGSEYLLYGDWYHKVTGWQMYPAKGKAKQDTPVVNEFKKWWENDLTLEALQTAYDVENGWRKDKSGQPQNITHPRELTAKAIAIQANPAPVKDSTLPTFTAPDESQFVPAPEDK